MDEERFIRLFDLMQAQKSYDEAAILNAEQMSAARLATYKIRLYDYLLNALQSFHKNHGTERKIIRLLDQVEILYQKGLYDQTAAQVEKAKKLAQTNGKDLLLAKALEWERRIAIFKSSKSAQLNASMEAVGGYVQTVLSDIEINRVLGDLHTKVYKVFSQEGRVARSPETRQIIERFLAEDFQELDYDLLSEAQKMKYNRSLHTAYMLLGLGAEGAVLAQNNRNIYEQSSNKQALNKDDYLAACNHLIISRHQQWLPHKALEVVAELRNLSISHNEFDTTHYQSRIFDFTAFHELEAHIAAGNHLQIQQILPTLEEQIQTHLHALNPVNVQSKRYRIALGYFTIGRYKESVQRIHQLLLQDASSFREDIQNSTDLLLLLNHFALGNWGVIENKVGMVTRLLEKTERLYAPEKHLLQFLQEQSTNTSTLSSNCLPPGFIDELQELEQNSPKGVLMLSYFNLPNWLRQFSRSQGTSANVRYGT